MARTEKVLFRVLRGLSDAIIRLDELRMLMVSLGFEERVRGSHQVFRRAGVEPKVNLQSDGTMAKPYQVRQMRAVILRYRLSGDK